MRLFINQDALEPILRTRAAELGARLRYQTECTALSQDADGVTAVLRDLPTGAESSVRAKYVVAADGNRSPVRERLGIGMGGHGLLSHSITIYFRALADLGPLLADRNQGVHYVTNPLMRGFFRLDRSGNAGFLVVNLVGDTSRPEVVAAFPSAPWANVAEGITEQRALELLRAAIGVPGIGVVIENIATWQAEANCADRFRDGRVFLAGDAAHVVPPNGGYGGNTGVQDAHNLAWKLAIAMQEGVGLDVVTDGELRRHTFIDQLTEQVEGLTLDSGDSGHVPVPFHDEAGQLKSVFTIPLSVTDKLRRSRMMTVEEFCYARARARRPVKVTLPSPLMLFLVWSPQRSRDAYPDPFEMFADGLRLMKEEAAELARLGCRYIQVDAPDFGQLVDQGQRDAWERAGLSVDRVFSEGADMLNELATVPGVSFGLHLCRGNYDSDWISTGTYDTISKQLFQRATNYDTFLLEYDDERSGSFGALGDVPDDKMVVLGLVSTKFDRMEPADELAARVREAGGFFPLDQLALSTQCGFASAGPGNQISEDAQENKLRLVAEVADRVLGLGAVRKGHSGPGRPGGGHRARLESGCGG